MMMKRVFLKGSARESCIPSAIGNLPQNYVQIFSFYETRDQKWGQNRPRDKGNTAATLDASRTDGSRSILHRSPTSKSSV